MAEHLDKKQLEEMAAVYHGDILSNLDPPLTQVVVEVETGSESDRFNLPVFARIVVLCEGDPFYPASSL